jgi:hypothetical protein
MSALIHFIHQHDGCKVVAVSGTKLTVRSIATINGHAMWVSETIEANMKAVRDWLGY